MSNAQAKVTIFAEVVGLSSNEGKSYRLKDMDNAGVTYNITKVEAEDLRITHRPVEAKDAEGNVVTNRVSDTKGLEIGNVYTLIGVLDTQSLDDGGMVHFFRPMVARLEEAPEFDFDSTPRAKPASNSRGFTPLQTVINQRQAEQAMDTTAPAPAMAAAGAGTDEPAPF